jgi:UDPglucose 6-dehydrogenase
VVTEWDEFKELDFSKIKRLLKRPLIIDGRNIYDPKRMEKLGFTYVGIGRRSDFKK